MKNEPFITTDYGPNHSYEVLNAGGTANIILICEHASNFIPLRYHNLGLGTDFLQKHIAWDIGMEEVTRQLSTRLNAPTIIAKFSRLLVDPNREEYHDTLIPHTSDGIVIPANQNLTDEEVNERKQLFYHPFHDRADELVKNKIIMGNVPLICGMHSFTPQMNGFRRPWPVGLLWNRDPRLADALIRSFTARGYKVGDNEPYSGRDLFFTMNRHGDDHGIPHVTIEIRQDEVSDPDGIAKWVNILTTDLMKISKNSDICSVRKY